MNMKSKVRHDKKGIMALDALIGTILSVIALFFILKFFFFFILKVPNNMDIAQNNGQSIVDFVDFFSANGKYNNFNSCYGMLKLSHLENYQYKDTKNYFYAINKNGVYIINFDYYNDVMKKKTLTDVAKTPICFNGKNIFKNNCDVSNKFDIYYDKTDQGMSLFGQGVSIPIFFTSIGDYDKYLTLKKLSNDALIILTPNLDITNKQNEYNTELIDKTNDIDETVDGKNLVFNKNKEELFITAGGISDTLVKKSLCFLKDLNRKDIEIFYSLNPDKIDYINNNVDFYYQYDDGGKMDVSFEWAGRSVCKKSNQVIDCVNLDKNIFKNSNNFSYKDFVSNINKYFSQIHSKSGKLLPKIIPLSSLEIFNKKYVPYFNDVFEKSSITSSDIINNVKNENYELYTIRHYKFFNRNFNHCTDKICTDVILKDGKAYFYIKKMNGFYSFDFYYLRKTIKDENGIQKPIVYYAGNIGTGEKNKIADYKIVGGSKLGQLIGGNADFYQFNIPARDENGNIEYFEVLLSEKQYYSILDLEK